MVRGYEILVQGRSSSTFQALGLVGHLGMVFVGILGLTLWMSCSLIENESCTFSGGTNQALIVLFVMPQSAGFRLPQSSEAHISAALSEEGVHLIGPLGDQAPPCIAPSWVRSLRDTAAVHGKSLLLNDTKSLFAGNGELVLRLSLGTVSLEA